VPVPGVLLDCDGGVLLLDTGFNTALITDPALRRRFHGDPVMRPVIPGPGEPSPGHWTGPASTSPASTRSRSATCTGITLAGCGTSRPVPVHAQRAEYEYAMQPGAEPERHGMFRIDYDDPGIDWRLAAGDTELAPGVNRRADRRA